MTNSDPMSSTPQVTNARRLHYVPTLDGWRAIAAGLVVLCHASGTLAGWRILGTPIGARYPKLQPRLLGIFNGSLGVDIFFALSGLLITYLIVNEKITTSAFKLGRFWVRRFFRIVPLCWFYICAVLVILKFGPYSLHEPDRSAIQAGFLFYTNYILTKGITPILFGHLWTLGLEMQFYFLWAALLKFVSPKSVPYVALGGVALAIAFRATSQDTGFACDGLRLDSRGDSLLWGAVFGALLARGCAGQIRSFLPPWLCTVIILAMFYVADQHPRGYPTWQPLLCALSITGTVIHSTEANCKWLEWNFLTFLGRISFSIYMWQQLLTGFLDRKDWPLLSTPISLIWIIPIAWISYRLIELPSMRLAARLLKRRNHLASDQKPDLTKTIPYLGASPYKSDAESNL